VLVETQSLVGKEVLEILTPVCESVHAAWINEQTTPIATSTAVLRLVSGELIQLAPCEVETEPSKYPSLGLSVEPCDSSALQWVRDGKTYSMHALVEAAVLLPFTVSQLQESDPLGEGAISEIVLLGSDGSRLLFRHIMPPMTLGIEIAGQAPNNSFKPTPLRGAA
jgi:hypothetical protein